MMEHSEKIKRIQLRQTLESDCIGSVDGKIERYLEIEHQGIIGGHHFASASSECIYLFRDGYFIGAVMMSHSINEGIIKFIAERNDISRHSEDSSTKSIEDLISEFNDSNIITKECADASRKIFKSYRSDIHHMNPKVAKIPFRDLARQNLKCLSIIEREIFGHGVRNGKITLNQPKYWDVASDGTAQVHLRLE